MKYKADAKDCEQCSPFSICCECKNIACYELEKQLKQAEQKLEKIKKVLELYFDDDWKATREIERVLNDR